MGLFKKMESETVHVEMILPLDYARKLVELAKKHGIEYEWQHVDSDRNGFLQVIFELPKGKVDRVLALASKGIGAKFF